MSIARSESIARARKFIREGVSASRWITAMRDQGISYRRTEMLADYREVLELEKKTGLARFVRKGYVPSDKAAELHAWDMSAEYMYTIRSTRVARPGEKPEVTYVNLMSDVPLTVEAIETEVWERSFGQSPPLPGEEREFMLETAIRRMPE